MKTRTICILLALSLLVMSCNLLTFAGGKVIKPSQVMISENRDVSGFDKIDFSTLGKINLMQGDVESLNISGPDNIVPEISTNVVNGTLVIKTKENIRINPINSDNPLTFTIVVKDLTAFSISGAGDVQMETLSTPKLELAMSGAGRVVQNQITTESLSIELSGLGGIDITGQATQARIELSGAGSVNAGDLKTQTTDITISGLGGATLWVTDQLTGNISGAGTVSYYGNPQTDTESSGAGSFESLGNK